MTISSVIPPALAGRPNWMGTEPGSKKPKSLRDGFNGEWKTEAAYADFPDALDALQNGRIERIGFVFRKDCGWICIDLDKVRNPETGEVAKWAQRVIDQFKGIAYIELSLSGCGFHIIFEGRKVDWIKSTTKTVGTPDPESKIEFFDEKFVILTGNTIEGSVREFGDGQEIFEQVYAGFFPQGVSGDGKSYGNDKEIVVSALNALNKKRADDHDDWLSIGMAVHSHSDDLLSEWEAWSRQSPKFVEGECQRRWESFSGEKGITLGTLFYLAMKDGWKPPADGRICNGFKKEGKLVPIPMKAVIDRIKKETGDWPRRVGNALFVHEESVCIDWLEKHAALFSFIGRKTAKPPKFLPNPGLHTKSEVFSDLQRTATEYEAIEELPHEPKIADHYYACEWPPVGNGDHLRELVGRFNPDTAIDGDLILAFFASIFWGGKGGTKPAFLIDSKDGRGVGKSTLAEMGGYLAGGVIALSANEPAEVIKQRLLSPEGIAIRLALLDNIKSLRFSWSELESMITAAVISGKRMYVGEARRPNNLLWCLTLNGASLSTDIAQRCVIIRVVRPVYTGDWKEDTQAFIDDHRQQIIGDIIGFLRGPRHHLEQYSRWGAWERDVLERLPDPVEAQTVILERQKEADVECEEGDILEDFIRGKLEYLDYCPSINRVFIPTSLMAEWFNKAHNERARTSAVTRIVKQKISEGKMKRLVVCPSRSTGRGFEWVGEDWAEGTGFETDINIKIVNHG